MSIEHGCLLIADISGYTKYLGGVELDHAQDILADLLGGVVEQTSSLKVAKLEGDAVFCYAATGVDGPSLVDTIESCYFAFSRRKRNIQQLSSCPCDACEKLEDLDLKFVVHFGEYFAHEVAGREELVGVDVILVHRLLKNEIAEQFGTKGYAIFTDAAIDQFELGEFAANLPTVRGAADDNQVELTVLDLTARWHDHQLASTTKVNDPTIVVFADVEASPSEIWPIMTSALERPNWIGASDSVVQQNERGIPGPGTINHCLHGDGSTTVDEIVDWAPFVYCTFATEVFYGKQMVTYSLEEISPTVTRIRHEFAIEVGREGLGPERYEQMCTYYQSDADRLADLVFARRSA